MPEQERKRDEPTTESQAPDPAGPAENDQAGNSPRPARGDDLSAADQALINQKRALESGEENVV